MFRTGGFTLAGGCAGTGGCGSKGVGLCPLTGLAAGQKAHCAFCLGFRISRWAGTDRVATTSHTEYGGALVVMRKPAARATDCALTCSDPIPLPTGRVATGGTVLINGLPAARSGDQIIGIDTHIIMIPTLLGPIPVPLPFPFSGRIDAGVSTSVLIGGNPAAVQGSTATNTPRHPLPGPAWFLNPPTNHSRVVGGSPNVLIGGVSPGEPGNSGTLGSDGVSAGAAAARGSTPGDAFLDITFLDRSGKVISDVPYTLRHPSGTITHGVLGGPLREEGLETGEYEIQLQSILAADWTQAESFEDGAQRLLAETTGFADGTRAVFSIWARDVGRPDRLVEVLSGQGIQDNAVYIDWHYDVPRVVTEASSISRSAPAMLAYSDPSFYFTVEIENCRATSSLLRYDHWIDLELKDEHGQPATHEKYILHMSNGEIRSGHLDEHGRQREERAALGPWHVEYPGREIIQSCSHSATEKGCHDS